MWLRRGFAVLAVAASTTLTGCSSGCVDGACSRSVRAVAIDPPQASILPGQTRQFTAAVTADDGVENTVSWSSANDAIVSVSQIGLASAHARGTTTIVAKATKDSTIVATATVIVPGITAIAVAAADPLSPGATLQLNASVTSDDGADRTIDWQSSDAAVISVSNGGLATAVGAGTAVVTARSRLEQSITGTVTISVIPTVRSVQLTAPVAPVYVGTSGQSVATLQADAGANTTLEWTASDDAIATVSDDGVVTGLSAGTVTITARLHGNSTIAASVPVTIHGVVRGVTISTFGGSAVQPGHTTIPYTATVIADSGVSTDVTWSTSNAAVATVSSTGVVTGVQRGTATISARAVAYPNQTATVPLTVGSVHKINMSQLTHSLALGATSPLRYTVDADEGIPTTVRWTSSNESIARVVDVTSTMVTEFAAGVGTAVITATSTFDPTMQASDTIVVVDQCAPKALTLGTLTGGSIRSDGSCGGVRANYTFTTSAAATLARFDVSASDAMQFSLYNTFLGQAASTRVTTYVIVPSGAHLVSVSLRAPSQFGQSTTYSINSADNASLPATGCALVGAVAGFTIALPLNPGCSYTPAGGNGEFTAVKIQPARPDGSFAPVRQLSVRVQATGFDPLIEIADHNGHVCATSSGQTGSDVSAGATTESCLDVATVNVTSRLPGQTGSFALTMTP